MVHNNWSYDDMNAAYEKALQYYQLIANELTERSMLGENDRILHREVQKAKAEMEAIESELNERYIKQQNLQRC